MEHPRQVPPEPHGVPLRRGVEDAPARVAAGDQTRPAGGHACLPRDPTNAGGPVDRETAQLLDVHVGAPHAWGRGGRGDRDGGEGA